MELSAQPAQAVSVRWLAVSGALALHASKAIIALYALSPLAGRPGALLRPAPSDGICMLPRIRLKQALMARGRCAVP